MISAHKIFALVALFGLVAGGKLTRTPNVRAGEVNLMEFMMRANAATQSSPEESMKCFSHYIPILNQITADYEATYAQCLADEAAKKGEVDESKKAERTKISESAASACQRLELCDNYADSIDYFECYVNGGNENAKVMYGISTEAADVLANVREEYRLIENQKVRCTNDADRAFVRDTDKTYDDLQGCIDGNGIPVETTTAKDVNTPYITTTPAIEEDWQ